MTPAERAKLFTMSWHSQRAPRPMLHDSARPGLESEKRTKAWEDEARNARLQLPPYAFHRDWLNFVALDYLPAVCADVGTGPAIMTLDKPKWWPRDEPGRVLVLRAAPDAQHCLFIDRASGFWDEPSLSLRGLDLLELVAVRHRLSLTKAAWRLARACKLRGPMP